MRGYYIAFLKKKKPAAFMALYLKTAGRETRLPIALVNKFLKFYDVLSNFEIHDKHHEYAADCRNLAENAIS